MIQSKCWRKLNTVLVLCVGMVVSAKAQTFTTLFKFDGTNGTRPLYMSPIQGRDGHLYGTTSSSAFRISHLGKLDSLSGVATWNSLILATNGIFYGMTGDLFSITESGTLTYLCGGIGGYGALVQGSDGYFYAVTPQGGTYGYGTVFKISPACDLTILHNFDGTDGNWPYSTLIQASDGNFYGTTDQGGAYNEGTVFRMTPSGDFTTLHSFYLQIDWGCCASGGPCRGK